LKVYYKQEFTQTYQKFLSNDFIKSVCRYNQRWICIWLWSWMIF